jgi:hypothetical protein
MNELHAPSAPQTSSSSQAAQTSVETDVSERRLHQRFVARRQDEACFWAMVGEQRIALNDLSVRGFSLPATPSYPIGARFGFTLQRDGVPDLIRGQAEVVNQIGNGTSANIGCRIVDFEGDGAERLQEWLVTHVICSATVRITEKDAAAIVAGRPLI